MWLCILSTEPLSFDGPAETDEIRRSSTSTKVLCRLGYIWDERGRSLGSIAGGQRVRVRFILVLREFIWNAPAVSPVLSVFDDTGSLGSPPRRGSIPVVSTLGNSDLFPCGK